MADGTVAEVARQAAAPRRGRFRVPAEARDGAVLARCAAMPEPSAACAPTTVARGALVDRGRPGRRRRTGAARRSATAGIPVLAFELEGARLSDAFLAMTEAG